MKPSIAVDDTLGMPVGSLPPGLMPDRAALQTVRQAIIAQPRVQQVQALKRYFACQQQRVSACLGRGIAPSGQMPSGQIPGGQIPGGQMYDGLVLSACLSRCCDQLLITVLEALAEVESPSVSGKPVLTPALTPALTLVALGGYGREELYPQSDLDILLLVDDPGHISAHEQTLFEKLLYLLWDSGRKVGHSVHNVDTVIKLAQQNVIFATSLLDMRQICGQVQPFAALIDKRDRMIASSQGFARGFMAAKTREMSARHQAGADHKQQLEPDLKEGIGTLRDIHHMRWLMLVMQAQDTTSALLSPRSLALYRRTHRHLATWRFALHLLPEGHNNRLQFHQQESLAQTLGYRQHRALTPMMRLMKHFFWCRYGVECLGEIVAQRLKQDGWLESPHSGLSPSPVPSAARVNSKGLGHFSALQWTAQGLDFAGPPQTAEALLSLFVALSEHPANAISADGWEMVLATRSLASRLRADPSAYRQIRAIVCQRSPESKALFWLVRSGVLGRIMPEFAHICGLGQWDGYHAYSVDNHTLKVIDHLHQQLDKDSEISADDMQKILEQSGNLDCLYVAALLHDIAKGMGGEHAKKGEGIAEKIAPLMGFDATEVGLIAWLVRHHLLLSGMALRRDILDPNTVVQLLKQVESPQKLNMLYCLTVADIRGVSAHSWTAWKASVLSRLYRIALPLINDTPTVQDRMQKKRLAACRLRDELGKVQQDLSDDAFNAHINNCSGEYLLSTEVALQVRHAQMLIDHPPLRPRQSVVRFYPNPDNAIVELVIYTANYSGLTAHTMATLSQVDYSIATMKVFPYADHYALLTVWFHQRGRLIVEPRRLENVRQRLESNIAQRFVDMEEEVSLQTCRQDASSQSEYLTIPTRIRVDNHASRQATVIEIQAQNRSHLLFDLCLAFQECNATIQAAKVDTFGKRALDVFYIRNRFGLKIFDQNHLSQIQQTLTAAIDKRKL